MNLEKPWSYRDKFPITYYYRDNINRIILTEGFLTHNINWLSKIRDNDFVLCFSPCHFNIDLLKMELEVLREYNLNKDRIYFLLGTKQDVELCNTNGINADFINHNAFLDENLFSLKSCDKIYDAILISRFLKLKRPFLASKIDNLCVLSSDMGDKTKDNFFDLTSLTPKYLGVKLGKEEVFDKISESYCGLFLSEKEGACFASSETLLCGIPVVSTPSEGGRDVWYNEFNSIISNDNEDSVKLAVETVKEKVENGFFNNKFIRESHISLALRFRTSFVNLTERIFDEIKIKVNVLDYFNFNFHHKMYQNYQNKELLDSVL